MLSLRSLPGLLVTSALACHAGCASDDGSGIARVQLHNDFNNPGLSGFQPPWTICNASYRGVEYGHIDIGVTSVPHEVPAGLDYVLMVAAWNDPSCDPAHALPIASKVREEVVSGQTRTITIGTSNHQGPCPPEGVAPIPHELYDRIRALWPAYNFLPYTDRTQNPQCAGSAESGQEGADAGAEAGG